MPDLPVIDRLPLGTDSRARRLAHWAVGLVHTAARYTLHRVPLFRRGRRHDQPLGMPDLDRDVPDGPGTVQRAAEGYGPLYHRRYRIAFTDAELGPEELIDTIRGDVNRLVPRGLAWFESLDGGAPEVVAPGRAYRVRLPGPWDGPVRVAEVDATSFTLVTLEGHMEAGQITFRTGTHPQHGWVTFEIESYARCGSRLFTFLYHRLPVGREMQMHMWASFCERVAEVAGGTVMSGVEADTHVHDGPWR